MFWIKRETSIVSAEKFLNVGLTTFVSTFKVLVICFLYCNTYLQGLKTERPESKWAYICTRDEIRGDFLRPPHKHLTPAAVIINKFLWNDIPEAKIAKAERKLQSRFYWDCSLTVMKYATLSTPPSTSLSGIQFSKSPNYNKWSRKTSK